MTRQPVAIAVAVVAVLLGVGGALLFVLIGKSPPARWQQGEVACRDSLAPEEGPSYCAAERLSWSYLPDTSRLILRHSRTVLNCAAKGVVRLEQQGGSWVLREEERMCEREPGFRTVCGYDNCVCTFDWTVETAPIRVGRLPLRIERYADDDLVYREIIWAGELDLSNPQGSVVIPDVPRPVRGQRDSHLPVGMTIGCSPWRPIIVAPTKDSTSSNETAPEVPQQPRPSDEATKSIAP